LSTSKLGRNAKYHNIFEGLAKVSTGTGRKCLNIFEGLAKGFTETWKKMLKHL
jgi:hypothetical protein